MPALTREIYLIVIFKNNALGVVVKYPSRGGQAIWLYFPDFGKYFKKFSQNMKNLIQKRIRRQPLIYFLTIFTYIILALVLNASVVLADTVKDVGFGDNLNQISDVSGYNAIDNPAEKLPLYIAGLIGWTGFMGINMTIQVILGGYEYMSAQDKAEKVVAAKKRIRNTIYAALILVSGYIIVGTFVGLFALITSYQG